MYIANVTINYDNITSSNYTDYDNCTSNENEDNNINFNYLPLSIPSSIIVVSLLSLMTYTLIKTLFNNKKRWRNFYTQIIQLDVLSLDPVNVENQCF